MSYDVEASARATFAIDVAHHRMIVMLDQGLHRHLVFQPRQHSWCGRFELITVPGSLTITGDHGSYTFRRDRDMFAFFRSHPDRPHRVNVSYWAEKLPQAGREVKTYSEEVTRELIEEALAEAVAERDMLQREYDHEYAQLVNDWYDEIGRVADLDDPDAPQRDEPWDELIEARKLVADAREMISDHDHYGLGLSHREGAQDLLAGLERIGLVSDTWEWDLTDWDFHFVWCLNAIAWGVQQYDRAIRAGLHVRRTGPMPWDTPLPTQPPAPQVEPTTPAVPVAATVTLSQRARPVRDAAVQGGVL